MNHLNIQFSIEEVERLCQLYIDCQLSVLEEAELEYVLRHCHFASTIINETKDLMAISRTLKLKAAKQHKGFFCIALASGRLRCYGTGNIYNIQPPQPKSE